MISDITDRDVQHQYPSGPTTRIVMSNITTHDVEHHRA